MDIPTLLRPRDVARALSVSEQTLANWRATGRVQLPFIKVGGKVMYRLQDLLDFIEKNTVRPTDE
jgi:predicted site-specific integrase-resolvase